MAVRPVLTFPNPLLGRVAKPVDRIDDGVRALISDMFETMRVENGVGLAAPQIGILERIVVVEIPADRHSESDESDNSNGDDAAQECDENGRSPSALWAAFINPCIVERSGSVVWNEGCLSVPGTSADVQRAGRVVVDAFGPDGLPVRLEAQGLAAVCMQHELDHLDGVLYIDRLSEADRAEALREYAAALDQIVERS